MRIEILGKNYNPSEKLEGIIERKIGKLERYFSELEEKGSEVTAKVVLGELGSSKYKMEITIVLGGTTLRSETIGDNQYDNIDILLPKIEKQIIKYRTKIQDKVKHGTLGDLIYASGYDDAAVAVKIVRRKSFNLKHLTAEGAQEELEFLGLDFYAFIDIATGLTNILYVRKDKNYGVVELK
jgi:putative sigma-54 modulation protein